MKQPTSQQSVSQHRVEDIEIWDWITTTTKGLLDYHLNYIESGETAEK